MRKSIFFLLCISLLFLGSAHAVVAQTDEPQLTPTCKPIFGGGQYRCEVTNTPSPTNASSTATPTATHTPTPKKSFPVEKSSPAKTTPPTGPEALSFLGLLLAATAGMYLNKKTRS